MKKQSRKPRRWAADPGTIYRVMAGIQTFTQAEQDDTLIPVAISWAALTHGTATGQDINSLSAVANATLVLSESVDPICEEVAIRAQEALARAIARHARTGRWGLDGQGLQDIPPCIDLFKEFLAKATPEKIKAAFQECVRRNDRNNLVAAQQTIAHNASA